MNQPQPQTPQFSIAELGSKFGVQLGQANAEIITLEKVTQSQQQKIQDLSEKEARLTKDIEDLEAELAMLKTEVFDLQQLIKEATLDDIRTLETIPQAMELTAIASDEK